MSLQVTIYSETGEKKGRVNLDLSKSKALDRMLALIREGKPGWSVQKSLEALDSGRLSISHVAQLFSADEIKGAIERRLQEIGSEDSELKELQALLGSSLFVAAQGGERARSRENRILADWKTVLTVKKSDGGTLRKSRRVGSASDVCIGFGWQHRDGDQRIARYVNGEVYGLDLTIEHETQNWTLHRGAREMAKSKGSPAVNASALMFELTRIHEREEKIGR